MQGVFNTVVRPVLLVGLFGLLLAGCGEGTATPSAASQTVASRPTTTATTATTTGAPANDGVKQLNDLGQNLVVAGEALKKNDMAGAKAAYKKFDDGWIDVETYVQRTLDNLCRDD